MVAEVLNLPDEDFLSGSLRVSRALSSELELKLS